MSGQSRRIIPASAVILASLLLVGAVLCQSGTSAITGVVSDSTGAAIPGAEVTLTNPSNNFVRKTIANEDGIFSFPAVLPASYDLEVSASNFATSRARGVRALVDTTVRLDFVLEPGRVSATVDVRADDLDSLINREDGSLGNQFVPRQITQLPTNLRRVNDILNLQPTVTREGYVAGGRSDQANITLDGIDINDQQTGGRYNRFQTTQESAIRASIESVEEFRITTMNPNADQGRSSGAQISLITKSGTNLWHGTGFYFYRPTKGSANDFFNNAAGSYEATDAAVLDGFAEVGEERVPRPSLSRDVFGGTLGGPLVKNKAFFFYSYEGQRQAKEYTILNVVPLPHMGQGELRFIGWLPGEDPNTVPSHVISLGSTELNGIYYQVGINPDVVSLLADVSSRYPANDTSYGDGINTGGFRFNSPAKEKENTHTGRFDLNLGRGQSLFFRGSFQWDNTQGPSYFPDTPELRTWSHPLGFALGHDWAINRKNVNSLRWGLTRQAYTIFGDSSEDQITFRDVFNPRAFIRTQSRVTETQNFTDAFTVIKGAHSFQLGGDVRLTTSTLISYERAYDTAQINPFSYQQVGSVLDSELIAAGYRLAGGQTYNYQKAAATLIGRLPQYSAGVNFDINGEPLPAGSPSRRKFANEEYDLYFEDIWRPNRNITLTMGLRYALSRPVYEKNGFQVAPIEPLGEFFERRVASSEVGVPLNDLIRFQLAGPANHSPGFYQMDWNNLQPRIAAAWSPSFKKGLLRKIFGDSGSSVFRGGFSVLNDHFGHQLAVSFDGLSAIGFSSTLRAPIGIYNVTDRPAPVFTGFDQDIGSLPGIPAPAMLFEAPADEATRIQTSLDATIVSPVQLTWNASFGRRLPLGTYVEVSYVGRAARNLFAARDVMALNNLVDPLSGMDWYTAAGLLVDARIAGVPINALAPIPYFENLFPNAMAAFGSIGLPAANNTQAVYGLFADSGFGIRDYTIIQRVLDDATAFGLPVDPGLYPNMFYHPQYAALSAFGTTAYSNYHGGSISFRQRIGEELTLDLNYTFSKSLDNASGLETGGSYSTLFILNSLRPEDSYASSDFDIRHSLNANFIVQLPVGQGKSFAGQMSNTWDAVLGGWQIAGVFRWNTGFPMPSPIDFPIWATNWNLPSWVTRTGPIPVADGWSNRATRNIFSDPQTAYNNFRNARPGETGERNIFRQPNYHSLDLSLSKTLQLPWKEGHKVQLRWEVFNVFNFQAFAGGDFQNFRVAPNPESGTAPPGFGQIYNWIQGSPRFMQFGVRYEF